MRDTADKVHQAIDATGAAQGLGDFNAFGLVGQIVAAGIEYWIHSATSFVKGLGDAGHDLADKVKTAQEMLSAHEENTKSTLTAIGKDIQS
ncbi:MAG TPA: hypothetical protein VJT49_08350 [Amycolatopsis sp.]|uniref:hypothetical protein n=1 Tax=Amycolatopsis sp. TaxID=37632 RepID=UPI002B46872B|nr:hypothetical protein [Amycolatopsis sp.]HKS45111.1 hypothetical protein [Amycolatopsis sp.]